MLIPEARANLVPPVGTQITKQSVMVLVTMTTRALRVSEEGIPGNLTARLVSRALRESTKINYQQMRVSHA